MAKRRSIALKSFLIRHSKIQEEKKQSDSRSVQIPKYGRVIYITGCGCAGHTQTYEYCRKDRTVFMLVQQQRTFFFPPQFFI